MLSTIEENAKAAYIDFCHAVEDFANVAEAENRLAAVSSGAFLRVFTKDAKELSELTGNRYIDYLEQAREMLLEGQSESDVLFHFDCILFDLKGR